MPILNYTTKVAPDRSAAEIQKKLQRAGAKAVLMQYDDDGTLEAISFQVKTAHGIVAFTLPANVDGVHAALTHDPNVPERYCSREQAARVTWRILKDWIEAQLAIIEAGLVELPQVFLPYAQYGEGQSVYDAIQSGGFKALTDESGSS